MWPMFSSLASMLGSAAVVVEEDHCQEVSRVSNTTSIASLLGDHCEYDDDVDVVDSSLPGSASASQSLQQKPRKRARSPATRNKKTVAADLLAMECSQTCTCSCEGITCSFNLRNQVPKIVQLIVDERASLHQAGRSHSSEYLFNQLLPLRQAPSSASGKYIVHFKFAGVPVCSKVWCELHGLAATDSRIKSVLAALRKGNVTWTGKKNRGTGGRGWRGAWCSAWIRNHVKKFAEFNPAKMEVKLDPEPLEVRHMLYVEDWNRRSSGSRRGVPLQFSRFAEIWKDFLQAGYTVDGQTFKLGMRQPRSGFSCTLCQLLMAARRKARTVKEREAITFKLKQHLQQVTMKLK